jgi:hypothetical protein
MKIPARDGHVEASETSKDNTDEEKEGSFEKRKDKKKNRRKKSLEMRNQEREREAENKVDDITKPETVQVKKIESSEEVINSTPIFAMLLPPPTTLISESLGRYKAMESSENFLLPKNSDKEEKQEDAVDLSTYVSSGEEELDQIWAHKQNEETFVSAETALPEESAETVEIHEEQKAAEDEKDSIKEEEKSSEMDISQFIE